MAWADCDNIPSCNTLANLMLAEYIGLLIFAFCIGFSVNEKYRGHRENAARRMRIDVLLELLQTPPHERSDRVLDLCFFAVAHTGKDNKYHGDFLTDEVVEHLERIYLLDENGGNRRSSAREGSLRAITDGEVRKMKEAGTANGGGKRGVDFDIPMVGMERGFGKEIERVRDCILRFRVGKVSDDLNGGDQSEKNLNHLCLQSVGGKGEEMEKEMIENFPVKDLEKGMVC